MSGDEYLGKHVRVYGGTDPHKKYHPLAEGEVIAYCAGPSITIRHSDGSKSSWSIDLPMDLWEAKKVPLHVAAGIANRLLAEKAAGDGIWQDYPHEREQLAEYLQRTSGSMQILDDWVAGEVRSLLARYPSLNLQRTVDSQDSSEDTQ